MRPAALADPLDFFGLHRQSREFHQIRLRGREGLLRPDSGHQAAGSGTERGPDDIEFLVLRVQPGATGRTVVVRPAQTKRTQNRGDLLVAVADEFSLVPGPTGDRGSAVACFAVEQLLQQHAPDAVHGRAHLELRAGQVERRAPPLQYPIDYILDFPCDFRLDDLDDFFLSPRRSPGSLSSTGRAAQIA